MHCYFFIEYLLNPSSSLIGIKLSHYWKLFNILDYKKCNNYQCSSRTTTHEKISCTNCNIRHFFWFRLKRIHHNKRCWHWKDLIYIENNFVILVCIGHAFPVFWSKKVNWNRSEENWISSLIWRYYVSK